VRGERLLGESLALWRRIGDQAGEARTLSTLGFLAQVHGDHDRATPYLERSLALARASGDPATVARALSALALSALASNYTERAENLCQEAVDLSVRSGDQHGAAAAIANMGLIAQALGNDEQAAVSWNESLELRRQIGDHGGEAHALSLLGGLAAAQGANARAIALFKESLALRRRMHDEDGIAPIFEGLAAVIWSEDPVRAVQFVGSADALRTSANMPPQPWERAVREPTLARLRARLDDGVFARAWHEGAGAALAQVMAAAETIGASADQITPDPGQPGTRHAPTLKHDAGLTMREMDVLRLLTFGLTYAQIAESLAISPRTVDAHLRSIYAKLEVRSRTAATRVALQNRLV
jgi:DNA-binding CsgD family transcriptional regulator